jgi:sirohydrochlorin ferrochelatase
MSFSMSTTISHSPRAGMVLVASLLVIGLAACDRNKPVPAGPAMTEPAAATAPDAVASASTPAEGMAGMDGMEGMDHAAMGHDQMTPEQMAELRAKVPLYQVLSDEQIMENMGRMPPDFWTLISSKDVQGPVGVLALGHGYKLGGNEQFEDAARPIGKEHPTAVAGGMAMMSSAHIQQAVDELTGKHGVKTIAVLPMEPGDDSSLVHQWKYIFNLYEEASWLSTPRVKTDAKIVFTKSPASDPRMGTIMRDHALEVSANPGKDRLIIVSHGPERPEDNPAELARLEQHAATIRKTSEFRDVKVLSIEDDAVPEIRAARLAELRGMVKEATDAGREVVIVPMILTRGGFHARLQKDLAGLNFNFANRGLIEHPLFQEWIKARVSEATG